MVRPHHACKEGRDVQDVNCILSAQRSDRSRKFHHTPHRRNLGSICRIRINPRMDGKVLLSQAMPKEWIASKWYNKIYIFLATTIARGESARERQGIRRKAARFSIGIFSIEMATWAEA